VVGDGGNPSPELRSRTDALGHRRSAHSHMKSSMKNFREVRKVTIRRWVPASGGGLTYSCRNRARIVAGATDSDDTIRRPSGMFQRGRREEIERGSRGSYRRGQASNREGNEEN
jgi:hypothetical protein